MIDPVGFARQGGVTLRDYQQQVARAVVESVLGQAGRSFAVMFPRQSGKNEVQAWVEASLLAALREPGCDIIKVSPTFRPQSLNAMRRLERALRAHPETRKEWKKEQGFVYSVGQARITFLSGAEGSNIVGATASALLQVDEAQDIGIEKYDREIGPMAASTRATRAFWGTAWTADTLLGRELRAARAQGGAFVVGPEQVGSEVPAYWAFVQEQVARLGRDHPMVRTQYFCEELESGGRLMFPPERIARMLGGALAGRRAAAAVRGGPFALLVDVGGEARANPMDGGAEREHDFTAATVVALDLDGLESSPARAPVYRPVERMAWSGTSHPLLFEALLALANRYQVRRVVVDATGVGAGLASFLDRALPGRVTQFLFNQASKSKLGWDFLAVVDSGRWQEPPEGSGELGELFLRQAAACEQEVLPGPGQVLRWGVPDGKRDKLTHRPLHDDLLISAALCALLDRERWLPSAFPVVIRAPDPIERERGF
jgi:hypothetical protein